MIFQRRLSELGYVHFLKYQVLDLKSHVDEQKVLRSTKLAISFYGYLGSDTTIKPGVEQYRSPEVVYGQHDEQALTYIKVLMYPFIDYTGLEIGSDSDTFSLGCVIAEVLRRRPLFPYIKDSPLYQREKTALYDTILGPIPDFLMAEIRGAATGRYQYPMFSMVSIDSTISATVSQLCRDTPVLEVSRLYYYAMVYADNV